MKSFRLELFRTSSKPASVPCIRGPNDSPAVEPREPKVELRTLDSGVAEVQVTGELDLASVGKLEAKMEQALAQDSARMLIDFTDCEFIDSSVLAVLAGLGGKFNASVPPRFAVIAQAQPLSVLRLTQLDREMPVCPTLAEAMRVLEVIEPQASVRPDSS
jgi:anti-sigma B factor antagonist